MFKVNNKDRCRSSIFIVNFEHILHLVLVFLLLTMNTTPEVWFEKSYFATLLMSHFDMGVLLQICCIFSEHFFLGTPLESCFWY